MENEVNKSYFAVIPANVRYDRNLTANAKLLYGEITALSNEKGYCWASDKYFADLYQVTKTTIQNWLKSLLDHGYISKEIIYREGTKEILYRYIKIIPYPTQENLRSYPKDFEKPTQKKLRDNNTFNNTINNTNNMHAERTRISELYQQKIKPMDTPQNIDRVQSFLEDGVALEVILYAIEISARDGGHTAGYVVKKLNDWQRRGVKTVEDAKLADEAWKAENSPKSFKKSSVRKEPIPKWLADYEEQERLRKEREAHRYDDVPF
ncbi:helix-turn-helix domain-containing protein [Enterococcus hirae]|uniref:helix-turn-helix domain-containing protein n=1 Tax=Enterococcus hirae TaxID=1354 RepID=UPI000E02431E|nr:helix-turn-helix domain-containing protein [Enterococcus hirae]RBT42386.1 hypothetical protein EB07_01797 [Enterococcus hirae]